MAATAHDSPANGEGSEKAGPIEQVLNALGLGRRRKEEARPEGERAGAGLVDQAAAFQSLTVADVKIPRADIVALELETSLKDVTARFVESQHSRLPIYRGTLDDPAGFVHIKDVFKIVAGGVGAASPDEAVLGRLRRECLYVPPSMRAADLLLRMQASHIHLALVIDEFGGVDGLVSLEDVIEAVVGEIDDEHDAPEAARIVARAGGVFEVDARASLAELEAALGWPLTRPDPEDESETIAGLVTAVAGRVPQRGEIVSLDERLDAEVVEADPRRIKRLRVRPRPPAPSEAGAGEDQG